MLVKDFLKAISCSSKKLLVQSTRITKDIADCKQGSAEVWGRGSKAVALWGNGVYDISDFNT